MKPFLYFLALSICLFSCRKGKKLPHEVRVQLITLTKSEVYPKDYFLLSDLGEPTEILISPSYVNAADSQEIASNFNDDLTRHLEKNNIYLQTDSTDYVLYIESMNLTESYKYTSYTDSCSWDYSEKYVRYSALKFKVTATLYKNGIKLDSWTREANSTESVRAKRDKCNTPKIFPIVRRTNALVNQVSKELRVKISMKMYELEK